MTSAQAAATLLAEPGPGRVAGAGRRRRGAGRRRCGSGAWSRCTSRGDERRRGGAGLRAGGGLAAAGRGDVRRRGRPAVGRHQHGRHGADPGRAGARATARWSGSWPRARRDGRRTPWRASPRRRCTTSRYAAPVRVTPLVVGDRLDTDIEGANRADVAEPARPHRSQRAGRPGAAPAGAATHLSGPRPAGRPARRPSRRRAGRCRLAVRRLDRRGCEGATVSVEGSGDPVDGLRALCVAWWRGGASAGRAGPGSGAGRHRLVTAGGQSIERSLRRSRTPASTLTLPDSQACPKPRWPSVIATRSSLSAVSLICALGRLVGRDAGDVPVLETPVEGDVEVRHVTAQGAVERVPLGGLPRRPPAACRPTAAAPRGTHRSSP